MAIPSNLYAEKVFSEHPLDLWALDDPVDYISLISEADRDISSWTLTGGSASLEPGASDEPFIESHVSAIEGEIPEEDFGVCLATSDSIINFNSLNSDMGNITISSYFNVPSSYVNDIKLGYEYFDELTGNRTTVYKYIPVTVYDRWFLISETFDYPDKNVSLKLFIEFSYRNGGADHSHKILVNGLTLGQWSEEYCATSLGVSPQSLPSSIPLDGYNAIEAAPYGISDSTGYYLSKNNILLAKNTGLPMVYGSSNITKINPDPDFGPSLILPGNGFLNESKKYSEMTLEFWLRVDLDSSSQQRLIGPIASTDGLYIRGPVFLLKVGNNFGTYFVNEWARPMLVHIRVSSTRASLLINGDEVVSFEVDMAQVDLPPKENDLGKDQDWIGVFSYSNFTTLEVDCIGIYSYTVPTIVAKRKFVYGQGVEFPENINTAYSGTSMAIDYKMANYANNYNYPETGRWQQGTSDNFLVRQDGLSTPNYSRPEIFSNEYDIERFLQSQDLVQSEDGQRFVRLNPESVPGAETAMSFENLNFISGGTRGLYCVLQDTGPTNETVTLLRIFDRTSSNYLDIVRNENTISYILKYNGDPSTLYSVEANSDNSLYSVGIDFRTFSNYFGGKAASFLGRKSSLSLYVGNNQELSANSYAGNIFLVGFFNDRSYGDISDAFSPNGTTWAENSVDFWGMDTFEDPPGGAEYSDEFSARVVEGENPSTLAAELLDAEVSTYVLWLSKLFDTYRFDIKVKSYWEDYIPLQYFAKYVEDKKGRKRYDVDFIQFNISYPSPSTFFETESDPQSWTYAQLYDEYNTPIQRSYTSLDNPLFTGYDDYGNLRDRSTKTYSYNTSDILKTYISFQLLSSGANAPQSAFLSIEPAPKDGIVRPGSNWLTTKYEVVNNMIIYPPKNIPFSEIAIVTHIESKIPGIFELPVKIKSLQYCSQSLSENSYNPIGTKFGIPIYPYKRSGIYYNFKDDNPFTIYKGSSPYLYLSRYSGIGRRGRYDPLVSQGLMIPMNQGKASDYRVIAAQMSIRYDEDFFTYAPVQILEIEAKDRFIKVYMQAIQREGKRARIYAVDARTGKVEDQIAFYWNGSIVKDPVVSIKEWAMLGIAFATPIDVANTVGFIRFTGPLIYNNVSHYQSTNLQEAQEISTRPWYKVKSVGATEFEWEFWKDFYLWGGVLVVSTSSFYGISPSDIYKTYTGTNKFIIDDDRPIVFGEYAYSALTGAQWQTQVVTPL